MAMGRSDEEMKLSSMPSCPPVSSSCSSRTVYVYFLNLTELFVETRGSSRIHHAVPSYGDQTNILEWYQCPHFLVSASLLV